MDDRWRRVGLIALFSVPPGVGMIGFTAISLRTDALSPVAVGAGALTTLAVAGFLVLATSRGTADESRADALTENDSTRE